MKGPDGREVRLVINSQDNSCKGCAWNRCGPLVCNKPEDGPACTIEKGRMVRYGIFMYVDEIGETI